METLRMRADRAMSWETRSAISARVVSSFEVSDISFEATVGRVGSSSEASTALSRVSLFMVSVLKEVELH